jgi:hypothetical protein
MAKPIPISLRLSLSLCSMRSEHQVDGRTAMNGGHEGGWVEREGEKKKRINTFF